MSGVVVTGSSSGIGRAIALRLAATIRETDASGLDASGVDASGVDASGVDASRVVVHYRGNREGAEETARLITATGVTCHCLQADLSDATQIERFADEAFAKLGVIRTWVNNAGLDVLTGEAKEWSFDEKLRALLDVDLCGTVSLSRIVGERLSRQSQAATDQPSPSMVFIGWDQAPEGMEGDAGMMFGPVKAAVMAFANSLAQTIAPHVRVNTVAPGWIQTAWGQTTQGYWDQRAKSQALMHRWGRPEDIAEAVAYLASPEASFVTGQTINLNGGFNRRYDKGL